MTKVLLNEVQKIVRAFMWAGRKGYSWRQMMKSKEHGGNGLQDIRIMAIVQSIKHVLCIWQSSQSIWADLI